MFVIHRIGARSLPTKLYCSFLVWLSIFFTVSHATANTLELTQQNSVQPHTTPQYDNLSSKVPLVFDSGSRQVALIELYTSQGCSSCPPAQNWLNQLLTSAQLWHDFIPLAFHVTYWDYIGWQDPFSMKKNDQRQYAYRQSALTQAVYTPQFVFSGKEWRGWYQAKPMPAVRPTVGNLVATVEGNQFKATFTPAQQHHNLLQLHVALLGFNQMTAVPRGENAGKKLSEQFVVMNYMSTEAQQQPPYRWLETLPSHDPNSEVAVVFWISPANAPNPIQATGGFL